MYKDQSGNEKLTLGKRTSLFGQKQEQIPSPDAAYEPVTAHAGLES